jgi:DNA uptake protein ComE-like DNA-binding protein
MLFKSFFSLPKSDRSVVLFLLVVAVVAIGLVYGVSGHKDATPPVAQDAAGASRTYAPGGYAARSGYYDQGAMPAAERFAFDPNTADSTQLLRLGLRPWQVRNIYKYRAHGGVYRKPQDFARLYGLTQKEYRSLEPYIRINAADYRPAAELFAHEQAEAYGRDTVKYPVKLKAAEHIALNLSDTSALRKVPGIGSYYARRIADYRRRLGGFTSVEQLREIEGFPEEALPYFSLGDARVRKINLNQLTLSQLKAHPYINFYQARDIVDYRRLKGPLRSLSDLRLLKDFPPEAIRRLEPYVEF